VSLLFPQPTDLPCAECGASVASGEVDEHVCDPERLVEFTLFQLRDEIEGLDEEVATYFETPHGRFEAWDEERRGRGRA
jgi:hypothetical protein